MEWPACREPFFGRVEWEEKTSKKAKVLSSSCFSVCLLLSVLDTGLRPKVLANKCGKIYKLLIAVGDLLLKYHVFKCVLIFVTILISKGVFKPIFVAKRPPELYKICNINFYKRK